MDEMRQGSISERLVERECWSEGRPAGGRATSRSARSRDATPADAGTLARTLRSGVIPRLVEAQRPATPESLPDPERLAHAALSDAPDAASDLVTGWFSTGTKFDVLCLDGLAPAARRLGEMWDDDRCDFAQVTLGTQHLARALRALCERDPAHPAPGCPRALFVSVPGEQHSLGSTMLVEIFRRSGWDAEGGAPRTMAQLAHAVRTHAYDVAGLSAGCSACIGTVATGVRSIRAASSVRTIGVIVGGRLFADDPSLAQAVGADGTARDAREALGLAGALVARSPRRSA